MLKHFFNLTCMVKKDKKKQLAITGALPEEAASKFPQNGRAGLDDTLDRSVAIDVEGGESPQLLDTSQFFSKVLADASFDAANLQNRATPIDFCTKEVRGDDDVISVVGRRRSTNTVTPSPIPEETEDNLTETITSVPTISPVTRDRIFEPVSSLLTPAPLKTKKLAEVYHSTETSPSASSSSNTDDSMRVLTVRARGSSSAHAFKPKRTPELGGSLRPTRAKRHSVAFHENAKVYQLDRRNSDRCEFNSLNGGFCVCSLNYAYCYMLFV